MQNTNAFVRQDLIEAAPPPHKLGGIIHWLHRNLFATWRDSLVSLCLTIICVYLIAQFVSNCQKCHIIAYNCL